ncbi:MAG: hypothetical protein CMM10_14125 [Rhodospirillaceae bacterium]|nr:hypothetical protein [Rhodospirillaceae bacterium]
MRHISAKSGMDMTVIYGHLWTSADIFQRDSALGATHSGEIHHTVLYRFIPFHTVLCTFVPFCRPRFIAAMGGLADDKSS